MGEAAQAVKKTGGTVLRSCTNSPSMQPGGNLGRKDMSGVYWYSF